MATEFPGRHIERLIQEGHAHNGPATRISAQLAEDWLSGLNGEDPLAALEAVMSKLGELPSRAEDFLGNELYGQVQRVLGREDEDEEQDDE